MGRHPSSGDGPDWVQAEIIEPGAPAGGPGWRRDVAEPVRQRGSAGQREAPEGARTSSRLRRPDSGGTAPAEHGSGGHGRSRTRWALGLLGVAVVIIAATAVVRRSAPSPAGAQGTAPPTNSAASIAASPSVSEPGTSGAAGSAGMPAGLTPVTMSGQQPLLPTSAAPVTVYGFTAGGQAYPPTVMRLNPRTGTEVDTRLPDLLSNGVVSVLAEPNGVIIRPMGSVPGYRVPDGGAPQLLQGLLAGGGPALPGPVPGSVWVPAPIGTEQPDGSRSSIMTLVDTAGRNLGRHVTLGPDDGMPHPDGAGGIVVRALDGSITAVSDDRTSIEAFPGGRTVDTTGQFRTNIGTGRLIATSPAGYVYMPCALGQHCQIIYVGRGGNLKQTMNVPPGMGTVLYGALSPDGSHLAVAVRPPPDTGHPVTSSARAQPPFTQDQATLAMFDLTTVTSWRKPWLTLNPDAGAQALAWMPDSHWLLWADRYGNLGAVSADGNQERSTLVHVRYLTHLQIRPGD